MRYGPGHKAEIHQKIVKDAARRVRAEGITGAAVSALMRDAGLTHGGFHKHFESKDDLLMESLSEAFQETADRLVQAAEKSQPGTALQAIVKTYLSPEHCDHAECGCPLASLAPELARADKAMKADILGGLTKYKDRMLPYMPGRRVADKERAFMVIFCNDAWSSWACAHPAGPNGTSDPAREHARFSLAQLLNAGEVNYPVKKTRSNSVPGLVTFSPQGGGTRVL